MKAQVLFPAALAIGLLGAACTMGSEDPSNSSSSTAGQSSSSVGTSSVGTSSAGNSSAQSSSSLALSSSQANLSSAISSSALSSSALSSSSATSSSSAASPLKLHCEDADGKTSTLDTVQVNSGEFTSLHCTVTQSSGTPLTLTMVRNDKSLTDGGWSASFCWGPTCYMPTTQKSDPLPLVIGQAEQFVYDVVPNSAGTKTGELTLVDDKNTVMLRKSFTIIAK